MRRQSRPRADRTPRSTPASRAPAADRQWSSTRRGTRGRSRRSARSASPSPDRWPRVRARTRPTGDSDRPASAWPAVGRTRRRDGRPPAAARRSAATTRTAGARARCNERDRSWPHPIRRGATGRKKGRCRRAEARGGPTSLTIIGDDRGQSATTFRKSSSVICTKDGAIPLSAVAYRLLFARGEPSRVTV